MGCASEAKCGSENAPSLTVVGLPYSLLSVRAACGSRAHARAHARNSHLPPALYALPANALAQRGLGHPDRNSAPTAPWISPDPTAPPYLDFLFKDFLFRASQAALVCDAP